MIDLSRMNNAFDLLQKIYSDSSYSRKISKDLFVSSISLKQGQFILELIQQKKPSKIIELGFGYGISALWIESGKFRPHNHIIVDPYQLDFSDDLIYKFIKKQKNVIFYENFSSQYLLAKLANSEEKIDMAFIDADERFDGVITDIYFLTKILVDNGTIVIRNVWNPSVRKAILFFVRNLPYTIPTITKFEQFIIKKLPFFGEIMLYIKFRKLDFFIMQLSGKDERKWNHFVRF